MKRLLFLAHRVPYPPDKGDRVRAFNEIKALAAHYEVTLAALVHQPADRAAEAGLRPMCHKVILAPAGGRTGLLRGALAMLGGRAVTEGYFASPAMARQLAEETRTKPFDLAIGYSSGVLPLLMGVAAKARVMDLIDVDSAKWADYARATWWPKRLLFDCEARRVARLEAEAVRDCRAVLLVSEAEAGLLRESLSRQPLAARGTGETAARGKSETAGRGTGENIGRIMAVGNGVDLEFFRPDGSWPRPLELSRGHRPGEETPSVVFTGTMDYRPNIEGVCWFVREVMPQLRLLAPRIQFVIVGRDPTPAVRELAREPGVVVTGAVPDVRPYLASAMLAIAPLRIARGVQNKVLEAMAMGRAVIASPQALEGLEIQVGRDVRQADSAGDWCDEIAELVCDPDHRGDLELAARQLVERNYSWPAQLAPLLKLCDELTTDKVTSAKTKGK